LLYFDLGIEKLTIKADIVGNNLQKNRNSTVSS